MTYGRAKAHGAGGRAGFSIIELLVAIIIIGILVAVLLPVISSRTEQARLARAQSDLQNLSESMERVGVDTGYYVRLFALNDRLRGDGVAFNRALPADLADRADGITDYLTSVPPDFLRFQGTPTNNSLFIDPETGLYATTTRDSVINRLLSNETIFDGSVAWFGPYINWQKDNNLYDNVVARDGIPDDPWGNDYILFTRRGMVLEPTGEIVDTNVGVQVSGGFNQGGSYPTEVFDRPCIMSLGPNGLPGAGNAVVTTNLRPGDTAGDDFGDADDLYHVFGK